MREFIACSLAVLVTGVFTGVTAGETVSGLQAGEKAGAFNVKDVTGPRQGTSLCYR